MVKYLAELTKAQRSSNKERNQQMMKALTDGAGKLSVSAAAIVAAG